MKHKMDLAEKLEGWGSDTGLTLYSFCKKFPTVKPRQVENLIERTSRPSNVRVWTAYEIISASDGRIEWRDFMEAQIARL